MLDKDEYIAARKEATSLVYDELYFTIRHMEMRNIPKTVENAGRLHAHFSHVSLSNVLSPTWLGARMEHMHALDIPRKFERYIELAQQLQEVHREGAPYLVELYPPEVPKTAEQLKAESDSSDSMMATTATTSASIIMSI